MEQIMNISEIDSYPIRVFQAVAEAKSFSRGAEKLLRTQPAVSMMVRRLEEDLGERLIDRSARDLILTDAGRIVLEYARRLQNLHRELENALAELRDNAAGRLVIGANESTTLYLLRHLQRYRRTFPRVKIQVRRSLSSRIPEQLLSGDLELGVISYDPGDQRLEARVIYNDRLTFVVSPQHRLAHRESVALNELGMEIFIAHNVASPYRDIVLRSFQQQKVQLNMDVEMPTVESIRKLVQRNEGVAFLPRMCVEQELEQGTLKEIKVCELDVERKIFLVYPADRTLSHAARAFLELVEKSSRQKTVASSQ
jgi:DNA-binding transcriptional LysR family regulator